MKIDASLHDRIVRAFSPLGDEAAAGAFPPASSLSQALDKILPAHAKGVYSKNATPTVVKLFTTASVNMWLRGIHSFLVSCSLTGVSPGWACVSGYYSSHYSIRAFAHLLGFFQLFSRRRIVHLQLTGARYTCVFDPKTKDDREHRFYWKIVKKDSNFATDPFFTDNNSGTDDSDVAHRDRASYADHLPQFPVFSPLDGSSLRNRIERISEIEFASPPIPRVSRYPDTEFVQIIAYHRLVRFRNLLDAVLETRNRFWSVHRDPPWARGFVDYQLTEEATLRSRYTL
ncbi:MAG TPA: hypothetical protein VL128_07710 [Candidatus Eisenbacteria bacterium]|nr:hypothetical protein [Candidatus Eisenbacteria bacterium]